MDDRITRFLPLIAFAGLAFGQVPAPPPPAAGPAVIDLTQALARAKQYAGQIQSANLTLAQATEDRVQAKAATKPQISALSQFIYTEGNGTPSGVFVSNDGIHVYNDQGLVHEDVMPVFLKGAQQRAAAAEAVARSKVDVAARGLNATVITDYYAIANAARKLENATLGVNEARRFVDITQKQETGGEVAHADVVKAQIQLQQRQIDLNEAQVTLAKDKIALAVLIFPDLTTDYSVRDDLDQADLPPPLPEARAQAAASNPDVKAASFTVDQAGYDVNVARYGYLPTVGIDFFYGLNSNEFGLHNREGDRNVGAAAQITVNIPVWNWGATKSKVKQAELRQDQARLDLSIAQRALQGQIASAHAEADGALGQVAMLRDGVSLAADGLRLTLLRYQAGEATAFEVADAQTTLKQARDAYDDGLARYRVALANLRTLMGTLKIRFGSAWIGVGLGVCFMAALVGCGSAKKEAAEVEAPTPVQVDTVRKGPIDHVVTADAVLYPVNQANVTAKIASPLKRVLVNRGDHVKAGQVLIELETADLAAASNESKSQYEQAQAALSTVTGATVVEDKSKAQTDVQTAQQVLESAQKVYDSRVDLQKQGALSQRQVDEAKVSLVQAQSAYDTAKKHLDTLNGVAQREQIRAAQAQVDAAKAHFENSEVQVSYGKITSPISGVVADRPAYPGEMPALGTPLISIVDISSVVARANVPVREAEFVKVGRPATITGSGGDVLGKVTVVSPSVDPNTTTVEIWVQAPNPGEKLKPGDTVHVAIKAETLQDVTLVPKSAILNSDEGGQIVIVVTPDNVAHERKVSIGVQQGNQVEIASGVNEGDKVVTVGGLGLDDGAKVIVKEAPPEDDDDN